ncbi:hypothetical protein [Helicobacter cetorum]|uniref:hypothetical protein n=1 Tax=Helicobacter cetorum TaxID=138563 RepID=UPI0018F803E8|nr:hypothetical protein [Helicobacter cetorum]
MAYYENITAGRGAIDSFNNALARQGVANEMMNLSMGQFANTLANAGAMFDNAKLREEGLKYQKMRDLYNDKQKEKAFDLQEKQALLSMEFAKKNQAFNDLQKPELLKAQKLRNQAMALENQKQAKEFKWLDKVYSPKSTPLAPKKEPVASVSAQSPNTEEKKTSLEEMKKFVNPMFKTEKKQTSLEEMKKFVNPMFRD